MKFVDLAVSGETLKGSEHSHIDANNFVIIHACQLGKYAYLEITNCEFKSIKSPYTVILV